MIPTEYLLPIGLVGSLNKRIIFPIAKHTADKLTGITQKESQEQWEIFDKYITKPVETITTPVESKVVETIIDTVLRKPVPSHVKPSKGISLKKDVITLGTTAIDSTWKKKNVDDKLLNQLLKARKETLGETTTGKW